MCWYVYMIETASGHLYTGISTDIERRFSEHSAAFIGTPKSLAKRGARYFRAHQPRRICYSETFANRALASKREAAIKRLSREQKWQIIANANVELQQSASSAAND